MSLDTEWTKEEPVTFSDVSLLYPARQDITVHYALGSHITPGPLDWIGIFPHHATSPTTTTTTNSKANGSGSDLPNPLAFQWAPMVPKHRKRPRQWKTTFPAKVTKALESSTASYYFAFVKKPREMLGRSQSFMVREETVYVDVEPPEELEMNFSPTISWEESWDLGDAPARPPGAGSSSDLSDIVVLSMSPSKERWSGGELPVLTSSEGFLVTDPVPTPNNQIQMEHKDPHPPKKNKKQKKKTAQLYIHQEEQKQLTDDQKLTVRQNCKDTKRIEKDEKLSNKVNNLSKESDIKLQKAIFPDNIKFVNEASVDKKTEALDSSTLKISAQEVSSSGKKSGTKGKKSVRRSVMEELSMKEETNETPSEETDEVVKKADLKKDRKKQRKQERREKQQSRADSLLETERQEMNTDTSLKTKKLEDEAPTITVLPEKKACSRVEKVVTAAGNPENNSTNAESSPVPPVPAPLSKKQKRMLKKQQRLKEIAEDPEMDACSKQQENTETKTGTTNKVQVTPLETRKGDDEKEVNVDETEPKVEVLSIEEKQTLSFEKFAIQKRRELQRKQKQKSKTKQRSLSRKSAWQHFDLSTTFDNDTEKPAPVVDSEKQMAESIVPQQERQDLDATDLSDKSLGSESESSERTVPVPACLLDVMDNLPQTAATEHRDLRTLHKSLAISPAAQRRGSLAFFKAKYKLDRKKAKLRLKCKHKSPLGNVIDRICRQLEDTKDNEEIVPEEMRLPQKPDATMAAIKAPSFEGLSAPQWPDLLLEEVVQEEVPGPKEAPRPDTVCEGPCDGACVTRQDKEKGPAATTQGMMSYANVVKQEPAPTWPKFNSSSPFNVEHSHYIPQLPDTTVTTESETVQSDRAEPEDHPSSKDENIPRGIEDKMSERSKKWKSKGKVGSKRIRRKSPSNKEKQRKDDDSRKSSLQIVPLSCTDVDLSWPMAAVGPLTGDDPNDSVDTTCSIMSSVLSQGLTSVCCDSLQPSVMAICAPVVGRTPEESKIVNEPRGAPRPDVLTEKQDDSSTELERTALLDMALASTLVENRVLKEEVRALREKLSAFEESRDDSSRNEHVNSKQRDGGNDSDCSRGLGLVNLVTQLNNLMSTSSRQVAELQSQLQVAKNALEHEHHKVQRAKEKRKNMKKKLKEMINNLKRSRDTIDQIMVKTDAPGSSRDKAETSTRRRSLEEGPGVSTRHTPEGASSESPRAPVQSSWYDGGKCDGEPPVKFSRKTRPGSDGDDGNCLSVKTLSEETAVEEQRPVVSTMGTSTVNTTNSVSPPSTQAPQCLCHQACPLHSHSHTNTRNPKTPHDYCTYTGGHTTSSKVTNQPSDVYWFSGNPSRKSCLLDNPSVHPSSSKTPLLPIPTIPPHSWRARSITPDRSSRRTSQSPHCMNRDRPLNLVTTMNATNASSNPVHSQFANNTHYSTPIARQNVEQADAVSAMAARRILTANRKYKGTLQAVHLGSYSNVPNMYSEYPNTAVPHSDDNARIPQAVVTPIFTKTVTQPPCQFVPMYDYNHLVNCSQDHSYMYQPNRDPWSLDSTTEIPKAYFPMTKTTNTTTTASPFTLDNRDNNCNKQFDVAHANHSKTNTTSSSDELLATTTTTSSWGCSPGQPCSKKHLHHHPCAYVSHGTGMLSSQRLVSHLDACGSQRPHEVDQRLIENPNGLHMRLHCE